MYRYSRLSCRGVILHVGMYGREQCAALSRSWVMNIPTIQPVFHLSVRLQENAESEVGRAKDFVHETNLPRTAVFHSGCRKRPRAVLGLLPESVIQHVRLAWSTIRPFGRGGRRKGVDRPPVAPPKAVKEGPDRAGRVTVSDFFLLATGRSPVDRPL